VDLLRPVRDEFRVQASEAALAWCSVFLMTGRADQPLGAPALHLVA
jgi:hypothetical protein